MSVIQHHDLRRTTNMMLEDFYTLHLQHWIQKQFPKYLNQDAQHCCLDQNILRFRMHWHLTTSQVHHPHKAVYSAPQVDSKLGVNSQTAQ